METITIRLNDGLVKEIESNLEPYYATKTDFIRECIRDKLKDLEREKIIQRLRSARGKLLSPEQQREQIKKLSKMSSDELFRSVGL